MLKLVASGVVESIMVEVSAKVKERLLICTLKLSIQPSVINYEYACLGRITYTEGSDPLEL